MKTFALTCTQTKVDGTKTLTNIEFMSDNIHSIVGYLEDFLRASGYQIFQGELQLVNSKPQKAINGN